MRYLEIINEERDAPLYHATGLLTAVKIIQDDALIPIDSSGISFTRSIHFARFWGQAVFVLDQNRLRQKYRLHPYQDGRRRHEAEEIILGSIKPLNKFLIAIEIHQIDFERGQHKPSYQTLMQHPLLKIVDAPKKDYGWGSIS